MGNLQQSWIARSVFLALAACCTAVRADPAYVNFNVLHTFTGGPTDGSGPEGALLQNGSELYGMTTVGGTSNAGTFFQINPATRAFLVMHSFSAGSDGSIPYGTPIQVGSNLLGLSQSTLFQINPGTDVFTPLHVFAPSDGYSAGGRPLLSGTTVYGTAGNNGVPNTTGSVYSYDLGSGTFHVLDTFPWQGANGYGSMSSLVQVGGYLYGMVDEGGPKGKGDLFRIDPSNGALTILHAFSGGATDGDLLGGGELTVDGTTLYGTTMLGGSGTQGNGTLFSFDTVSQQYNIIHAFTGSNNDPLDITGPLVLSGDLLYGLSLRGGSGYGTVFDFNLDDDQSTILHAFTHADGYAPYGSLIMSGSTLYGMTSYGDVDNIGNIFSVTVPEPCTTALLGVGVVALFARRKLKV